MVRPSAPATFLSHAGADTQASRQFAEVLRRNGSEVWFDQDNLQPGDNWIAGIEEAISRASAMIVYIGRIGIQAWVDREVRLGLVRNNRDREAFRFIPVLGEGADLDAHPVSQPAGLLSRRFLVVLRPRCRYQ